MKTHKKEIPNPHLCNFCDKEACECSQCNKTFSDKSNLILHIKTHKREMLYNCTQCEMTFAVEKDFISHIITHTGDNSNQYSYCDKIFVSRKQLLSHLMIHSVEKPYKCRFCVKKISEKVSLRFISLATLMEKRI